MVELWTVGRQEKKGGDCGMVEVDELGMSRSRPTGEHEAETDEESRMLKQQEECFPQQ